jgi:hypothetical protein
VDSWKEKCPGYEIKIWDTTTFDMGSSLWVQQAFEKKKYAFAADYIRFWAVYSYGGIYLDSDVEVIKNFDDLLHLTSFMGFAVNGSYEPAIIGAVKHQEWLAKCMAYYQNRQFIRPDGRLDMLTLPDIVEPVLLKNYGLKIAALRDNITTVIDGALTLFPYEYFSPDSLNLRITKNTYTVHHYNNSWTTPAFRIRSKIFRIIATNKILFAIYTNTWQQVKCFVKTKILKQHYYIYKHK